MEPILKKLSNGFSNIPIIFDKVNCEDSEKETDKLSNKIGIKSYPTLFYLNKKGRQYMGKRDEKYLKYTLIKKYYNNIYNYLTRNI